MTRCSCPSMCDAAIKPTTWCHLAVTACHMLLPTRCRGFLTCISLSLRCTVAKHSRHRVEAGRVQPTVGDVIVHSCQRVCCDLTLCCALPGKHTHGCPSMRDIIYTLSQQLVPPRCHRVPRAAAGPLPPRNCGDNTCHLSLLALWRGQGAPGDGAPAPAMTTSTASDVATHAANPLCV